MPIRRRYTNRYQILKAIDQARIRSAILLSQAEEIEEKVFNAKQDPALDEAEMIDLMHESELANAMRLQAQNLVNKRIPRLGKKLAEFDTDILPGVVPDKSVEQRIA